MADFPDRDTVDTVVIYDLALTLLAKADLYPQRIVNQAATWLRERVHSNNDENQARLASELATVLENIAASRDG